MFCPQCRAEYHGGQTECPECQVPLANRLAGPGTPTDSAAEVNERASEVDLDVLIRTGFRDPIAIGLVGSLLQEARIPFFAMDQNVVARQESGNAIGWWSVRVPREREAEAREILQSVERMK
jgi:hypothetical protein